MLEAADRLLGREDEDIAQAVTDILAGDGIRLVTGAAVVEVRDDGATVDRRLREGRTDAHRRGRGRARRDRPPARDLGPRPRRRRRAHHRRVAPSRSTSTCAPASRTSSPSATSTAARSSPTSPSTTPASSSTSCSATGTRTTDRPRRRSADAVHHPAAGDGRPHREGGARSGPAASRSSRENVADIIAMPRAYTVEETRGVMKFIVDADTDLDPRRRAAQHRRPGAHQHRHPGHAPRHHRHRAAGLDLHPPQLDRGVQRGVRQGPLIGARRRRPAAHLRVGRPAPAGSGPGSSGRAR